MAVNLRSTLKLVSWWRKQTISLWQVCDYFGVAFPYDCLFIFSTFENANFQSMINVLLNY